MKRNAMFIALAMVSLLANAETITGRYSSNLPFKKGEISISNKRTGKSTQLDKKGRFALRNVDIDHDTLVLFAANRNRTTFLPAKGCVEFIIKEEDDKVDVLQKRMVQEPAGEHGGQIYLKESLEKTGESMTLAAVNTRAPRSTVYTTFTGNTEPIYFVDNIEVAEIATLPLSEVAYVEIVRPSSPECAALGARGANGMIFVTTENKYRTENPAWNEPREYHVEIQIGGGK